MTRRHKVNNWIVAYLVPGFVYRFYWKVRHPKWWWENRVHHNWVKSVKVNDVICDCRGEHHTVVSIDEDKRNNYKDAVLEDNHMCDLYHCGSPVKEDNSCHSYYMDVDVDQS